MGALISAILTLVLVGVGIAIIVGQISPEEVFKRAVGVLVLALVVCGVLAVVKDVVFPILVPALESAVVLGLKFLATLLALALIGNHPCCPDRPLRAVLQREIMNAHC